MNDTPPILPVVNAAPTRVHSEIAQLELIVTSRPEREFERMIPANLEPYVEREGGVFSPNPDYLLFDDLVLLSALKKEHAQLDAVIRAVVGDDGLLTWRELLVEVLGMSGARDEAIDAALGVEDRVYGLDRQTKLARQNALHALGARRLATALISGVDPTNGNTLLRWPAPNILFARDLASVTGDAITLTHAARPARMREMALSGVIMRHHRRFAATPKLDITEGVRPEDLPRMTLEGGDIQVLSSEVVLVGVGIRTTLDAVEALAPKLFDRGFEVVLAYEMPRRRAAMHIDTLFTRIDHSHCLIYPPLIESPQDTGARVYRLTRAGRRDAGVDLLAALASVDIELSPIFCGGDDPVMQRREQWSDGANAFALAPGVIVSYGRNERTLRELNRHGYEVVDPERFIKNALYYIHAQRKVVVALEGHELVRGRGGPRCLTMPLRRAAF